MGNANEGKVGNNVIFSLSMELDEVIKRIKENVDPITIFLYGSRTRGDFTEHSDYEVGVLMSERKYVSRRELAKLIDDARFTIYPFRYEQFIEGDIDTPFQKTMYLRELISTAKVLYGEEVFTDMPLPKVHLLDLMQRVRFDMGFSLASVISYRSGDECTAFEEFYKSCFYGLRCLEILELQQYPFSYTDIFALSKRLDLKEYTELISIAYDTRVKNFIPDGKYLFKNISFLNSFVEPKLEKIFVEKGNIELIVN